MDLEVHQNRLADLHDEIREEFKHLDGLDKKMDFLIEHLRRTRKTTDMMHDDIIFIAEQLRNGIHGNSDQSQSSLPYSDGD